MITVHPVLSNGQGNVDLSQVSVQIRLDGKVEVTIPTPGDVCTVTMDDPKEDVTLYHGSDSVWRALPTPCGDLQRTLRRRRASGQPPAA